MVLIAGCLGLRVSEIVALQGQDFDFAGLTLLIEGKGRGREDRVLAG
jgi:integrase